MVGIMDRKKRSRDNENNRTNGDDYASFDTGQMVNKSRIEGDTEWEVRQ
jgi:hypothetical protein